MREVGFSLSMTPRLRVSILPTTRSEVLRLRQFEEYIGVVDRFLERLLESFFPSDVKNMGTSWYVSIPRMMYCANFRQNFGKIKKGQGM